MVNYGKNMFKCPFLPHCSLQLTAGFIIYGTYVVWLLAHVMISLFQPALGKKICHVSRLSRISDIMIRVMRNAVTRVTIVKIISIVLSPCHDYCKKKKRLKLHKIHIIKKRY